MNGLEAPDLMDIMERGRLLGWVERGLLMLAYAWPGAQPEQLQQLPIGVRDRLLIHLRMRTFGNSASLRTACSQCNTELEAELDLGQMLDQGSQEVAKSLKATVAGRELAIRLPCSQDLLAVQALPPEEAELALLQRCLEAGEEENQRAWEEPAVCQEVSKAIAESDVLASIEVGFNCRECGHAWEELFDIVTFLWRELEVGARRLSGEVHSLARAYGWTEKEILSLSPSRRSLYLSYLPG